MNSILTSLAGAVKTVAPTLATMLLGPLAGTAVTALEGAFGLAPSSGAQAITQVIQNGAMSPDIVAKIRAADQAHEQIIGQQKIDLVKINNDYVTSLATTDAADRDSARKREETVKDHTPAILAFLIIGANLVLIGCLCAGLIKSADAAVFGLVGTALGYLVSESKAVLAYYFGSSRGSDEKNDTINKAMTSVSHQ